MIPSVRDGSPPRGGSRSTARGGRDGPHGIFIFAILFSAIFLLHAPLLRLPYFWDEAGYYVPAARDLWLTGSLIPHSTLSNAHPPLGLAWLALWWKLSGFTPAVTRTAMLLVAALALTAVFRLASDVANSAVAVAATLATALYAVFFAQSSMAHADLAGGALVLWGVVFYVNGRRGWSIVMFCLAVLAKETSLIAPLSLAMWEAAWWLARRMGAQERAFAPLAHRAGAIAALVLVPAATLAAWYGYHYTRTDYVFGNPQFFEYNVAATLHPLRVVLAVFKRVWHLTGYMNLFVLTLAAAAAMLLPPQVRGEVERPRIALRHQASFAVLIAGHAGALSLVGGAPLARYLLPVLPLVILLCVATLWRRVRHWVLAVAIVCAAFVLALFVNPPHPFAPEDNLAYRDYVLLHKRAGGLVEQRYARARVLTAWPVSDELRHPYLGYARISVPVVPIEDFSERELLAAASDASRFDVALLFSTKYEPPYNLLSALPGWERLQERFFGYHHDLPPEIAARILGGRIVFHERRGGQWIALIEIERPENAAMQIPRLGGRMP